MNLSLRSEGRRTRRAWALAAEAAGLTLLLAYVLALAGGGGSSALAPSSSGEALARLAPLARAAGSPSAPRPERVPVGIAAAAGPAAPRLHDVAPPPLAGAEAPRTEREHYQRYRARCAAGGAALAELEAEAPALLRSDAAACAKVALLRALTDAGAPTAESLLALALAELPDRSTPHGESVPAFTVGFLGQLAHEDHARSWARRLLGDAARGRIGALEPRLRGQAFVSWIETATADERHLVEADLALETDPLVAAMAHAALRGTSSEERGP